MDRREALKKLGAAGAIAAGGSVVLSSNSVAFAASGNCLATIPDPADFLVSAPSNPQSRVEVTWLAGGAAGVNSTTYVWRNPALVAGAGSCVIQGGNTGQVVDLQRKSGANGTGSTTNWGAGDQFRVDLEVTWDCITTRDVATYRVIATYPGAGNSATISVSSPTVVSTP